MIAIPCMDSVPSGFNTSLLYLEKGENVSVNQLSNSLVYDARNIISINAITQGFDRVMWFDSDMMFTKPTMKMLMADMDKLNADMVTGVYFKRRPPYSPVIYDKLEEPKENKYGKPVAQVTTYDDFPRDTLFPVRGCGFGCVLTSVKLLKEVWDKFGPAFSPLPWAGEDMSFCYRVNQLGHQIWCDSNIMCGHIGTYVYTEKDFEAYRNRGDADGQT